MTKDWREIWARSTSGVAIELQTHEGARIIEGYPYRISWCVGVPYVKVLLDEVLQIEKNNNPVYIEKYGDAYQVSVYGVSDDGVIAERSCLDNYFPVPREYLRELYSDGILKIIDTP